jgi:hypothetical protein
MDRKKYIVEASDDVKKVIAMGVTHGGAIWTDTTDIEKLEELNSDYINEHFGSLQDTAYKKGLHDGESKCGYCNEYQRGLDDAWEAARKIVCDEGIDMNTLCTIFRRGCSDSVIRDYSAAEAIAKLKAYEEKQKATDDIKVGDEVRHDRGWSAVVTSIDNVGLSVMDYNGEVASYSDISKFTKTGRHFDIDKILEAMKA